MAAALGLEPRLSASKAPQYPVHAAINSRDNPACEVDRVPAFIAFARSIGTPPRYRTLHRGFGVRFAPCAVR